MKTCRQCQRNFEVTNQDRTFYDKVSPIFGGKKYPIQYGIDYDFNKPFFDQFKALMEKVPKQGLHHNQKENRNCIDNTHIIKSELCYESLEIGQAYQLPDKTKDIPDERHKRRMALRNQRQFPPRPCSLCGTEIHTSYAPESSIKVYCEKCYLQEIY